MYLWLLQTDQFSQNCASASVNRDLGRCSSLLLPSSQFKALCGIILPLSWYHTIPPLICSAGVMSSWPLVLLSPFLAVKTKKRHRRWQRAASPSSSFLSFCPLGSQAMVNIQTHMAATGAQFFQDFYTMSKWLYIVYIYTIYKIYTIYTIYIQYIHNIYNIYNAQWLRVLVSTLIIIICCYFALSLSFASHGVSSLSLLTESLLSWQMIRPFLAQVFCWFNTLAHL